MNRVIVPVLTLLLLGGAVVPATLLPAPQAPVAAAPVDTGRIQVVCPSFADELGQVRVAAVADGDVAISSVTDPDTVDNPDGTAVLTGRAEPVVVAAARTGAFGAATVSVATAGADRGLGAVGCSAPSVEQWFTGVMISDDDEADLLLSNTDATDAAVDITVYGEQGRLSAPGSRGIVVPAHATTSVPINVQVSSPTPVTLHLETSQGRVAATLRQRTWDGLDALGADWIAASAPPATQAVIPALPEGAGTRQLVLTNPGKRAAGVTVEVLGAEGRSALPGLESVQIPAGTTRAFPLEMGAELDGLLLTSEREFTASVRATSDERPARSDPWYAVAAPALDADGMWAVPAGRDSTAVLALANPGDSDATVEVTSGSQLGGPGTSSEVTVAAGSVLAIPLDSQDVGVIRLRSQATGLRAAVALSRALQPVAGVAVVGLVPADTTLAPVEVGYDPHTGQ